MSKNRLESLSLHRNHFFVVKFTFAVEGCLLSDVISRNFIHFAEVFEDSSTINIYGYDFSEFPAFSLTGYLSDGSPFEFIELTYAVSHINLIVIPEPVTVLLLGLGGLFLRWRT